MKQLLLLPFFLFLSVSLKAQTALDPQEIRHSSFVAIVDPEDGSTSFLMQVSRNSSFTDLVVDEQWIVSGYANDPLHKNSPLRVKNLSPNTTYYYRFSYDIQTPSYGNIKSVTTWNPPETPVLEEIDISTYEVTINWESNDPDVAGFEIWVYGASGCFEGGTMVQDNILTVGPNDRSITYDFVFFDESTYRFSIYALNSSGEYGDPDSKLAMSCVCYEEYDLSTLIEDYNIELDWSESLSQLNLSSLYYIDVNGESIPASFFSSSNGGGKSINQYLNWEWDISGNWEVDHEQYSRNNRINLIGSGTGTFSVRLVDPCTGASSAPLSYAIKDDQTISFGGLPSKTFGDPDFSLAATASSGLPVSYSSSDESVATISGNTLSILSAGSTIITASQGGNEMYHPAEDVNQTLTVNKANQTISFGTLNDVKYSDDPLILGATSSSGLAVSYSSSDESIIEIINGNEAHPVGVGTVTITASQTGNSDYNSAPSVDQELTVLKGDQVIDFDEITGTYNVNNSGFSLNATASSGLSVTYSSSDESVATISGSYLNIKGAGTTTITASQSGNNLYNPATDEVQLLTVNKLTQTVNVPNLSGNSYTYGQSATPIQVTTDSGLESMDFESSDESVFTIQNISNSGGGVFYVTLGIIGAGSATFTATQQGDENYEADMASSVVNVSKANQTITFPQPDPVFYGDADFELLATSNSGLEVSYSSSNPSVAAINGTTVSIISAGETTITATQAGNDNYNPAEEVLKDLTVMKLTQTIAFDTDMPAYATFGDGPFSFAVAASSGLPVTFEIDDENVLNIENGMATIVGAGTAIVTATQVGNQNYHQKESTLSVEVEKASQSITFSSIEPRTFGDDPFTLNASANSGLEVSYTSGDESVATILGNEVTIHNVGSTLITALQSGNDNYYAAGQKIQTLTVNKANQEIIFDEIADQDLGSTILLTASASSGLTVSFSVSGPVTLDGNELTTTSTGLVMVTASQSGNSSYNAASDVVRSFEVVDKESQTITFTSIGEKTFGDDPFSLSATTSSGLEISYTSSDENIATISGSTVTIINAGTTTITASQSGNEQYHPAADVQQVLTVNKLGQSINFELGSDATKTYGDDPFSLVANSTSGLPIVFTSSNSSIAAVDDESIEIYAAGTVTITASQPGNQNYLAAEDIVQTLVINKADQEIVFDPSFIEDQPISGNSISLDIYGNPYGLGTLSVEILDGPATISEIGPDFYEVTFTGAGEILISAEISETDNYSATSNELAFTVFDDTKQNQIINFDPPEPKTFGDENFSLLGTSSSGLPVLFQSSDESVASIVGTEVAIVGAGTTTITASQSGNEDYNAATPVTHELIVNKAEQSISFQSLSSKSIDDEDFELIATSSSGLEVYFTSSNENVVTIVGNIASIVGVGNSEIVASQEGNSNYKEAQSISQTLIVNDAKQTQNITFEPLTGRVYGEPPFQLNAFSSSGLGIAYESSDESVVIISGDEASIVGAGTALITASQAGNDDFESALPVARELVINKANQTIQFEPIVEKRTDDADFSLVANASSGLEITFTSSNQSVATLSGDIVSIVGEGSTVITAIQEGNSNFNAAPEVEQTLLVIIPKQYQTISFEQIPDKTFGDAPFKLSAASTSGLTISYVSSDESVATISGDEVTIVGAGATTITASQTGNDEFLAADDVSQSLLVNKAAQSITFDVLEDKVFGDASFTLSASTSSGLPVTFESSDESIAAINEDQVSILAAGQVTISAIQGGDANYEAASNVSQGLVISKADQTITFESIEELSIGETIDLTATATSGLDVSFEVDGPGSLDGISLSILDEGTLIITASQAGDANWNPAESVSQTLQILGALGLSDKQITIFPNPFMDILHLDYPEPVDIRIYGMNGSMVWSKDNIKNQIDVSSLDEGMYILEVEHTTKITRLRIRKAN